MKNNKQCLECASRTLRWYVDKHGPSDVVDGRLRMSEISVIAYLACEECSATVCVIMEDAVNEMLNRIF